MLFRTDAVVLRSMEYGETSHIVSLFTREKGRISVLAKGSRLPKSRFGAALQPLAYTQVVFYYKATRGLQTLRESALVEPLLGISRSLEKLRVGLRMVELVYGLVQEEDPSPPVFNLVVDTLRRLNAAEANVGTLLPYFELRLSTALGFAADVDRAAVEAVPPEGGLLLLDTGAIVPANVSAGSSRRASRAALRAFAVCARAAPDDVLRMRLTPSVRRELEGLTEDFLHFHTEEAYPMRGVRILEQLGATPPHNPG